MVWTSINYKLRHLLKIFMSYVAIEIKLNRVLELTLFSILVSISLLLSFFI